MGKAGLSVALCYGAAIECFSTLVILSFGAKVFECARMPRKAYGSKAGAWTWFPGRFAGQNYRTKKHTPRVGCRHPRAE
jgi:hypothetical protein